MDSIFVSIGKRGGDPDSAIEGFAASRTLSKRRSGRETAGSFFFWLVAAWVKSRAERPSVSGVNRQLHVQIGCKLRIRNREDELTKQAKAKQISN